MDGTGWPADFVHSQSSQFMSSSPLTISALNSAAIRVLTEFPSVGPPTRIASLDSAGGFSGARIWRVDMKSGWLCLRAMPADRVNLLRLRGLHRLLAHVRACGISQVAVPIATRTGGTHVLRDDHVWQVEPWMPGVADYASHSSPARLHAALTLLAHWHLAARSFAADPTEREWFATTDSATSPGIAERLSRIGLWGSGRCALVRDQIAQRHWKEFDELGLRVLDLYGDAAPRIAAELTLGLHARVRLQPCLRDVWHDHVLFTGDDVTGLIDAHASRTENITTDLARLLGSLCGDDRHAWEIGLAAYETVRPLGVAERGLLELFDRSAVLLNGLTWLEWKCIERRRFENPEVVLSRMKAIVGRLERLCSAPRTLVIPSFPQ